MDFNRTKAQLFSFLTFWKLFFKLGQSFRCLSWLRQNFWQGAILSFTRKVKKNGFDESLTNFFQTYLNGRYQTVLVRLDSSYPLPVLSGFPQGSVLGPLLFLIFINDLPSIILDAFDWLYADDLKLLFKSLNFQNDLSKLMNWNIANGMLINASKTICISFKGHVQVDINSVPVENVINHSDLWVLISHKLKWEPHLKLKLSKANKSFFLLKQPIPWSSPSRVKLSLYSSTNLSVLLYASPVWNANFTMLRKLELFQKRCFFGYSGKLSLTNFNWRRIGFYPSAYSLKIGHYAFYWTFWTYSILSICRVLYVSRSPPEAIANDIGTPSHGHRILQTATLILFLFVQSDHIIIFTDIISLSPAHLEWRKRSKSF